VDQHRGGETLVAVMQPPPIQERNIPGYAKQVARRESNPSQTT
jgi:hypothetical protein